MLKRIAKTQAHLRSLRDDTEGATMIEYSLLIGLITVAMIVSLVFVGGWVTTQWQNLVTAITP